MISLFPHNETAYVSVLSMLAETGKAAVVHPTGTGKSFIGFKLCEDHPDKTVCWLSPSEYIFRTQIENLKAVSDGYEPDNIRFYTYAKLMNLSEDELSEIQPDYIILDEFHRAGAEQWGLGVQNLLKLYPMVPILGLSATAIRYLDNQRDMTDELFEGNVASEMTLGEAIVRGILNPPKYVLSVFCYQNDLEKYRRKVKRAKNKAVRDAAEEYLEALRRALDKADGLEDIFDRHMTERTGKYIVFCANYEHLCEMQKHTEWFEKVDKNPHIYTVYTEDPSASKSFQAFKDDRDNTHLRLLYAIDALNEGIHLDDISGVILLRPTVSPIIYKQQIGRALAAGKKKEPVIFDIVNNIENLYSIDSLEREMQNAVLYFRNDGMGQEIVNEHFRILDEVRDCRELFARLNDTLTASWEVMYGYAKAFFEEHGHLDVPKRYTTIDGYSLGSWLLTQRRVYAGEINGWLTDRQIEKLNGISMIWDGKAETAWKQGYEQLRKYKEEHGDLDISSKYITEDGFALGQLVTNIRTSRDYGRRSTYLTPEHERMLNDLGFIWDKLDYAWEQNFLACMKYKLEHGHLNIPAKTISADGLAIGAWIRRMRSIRSGKVPGRLTEKQIQRLDEIGFPWDDHFTQQ
ncbi:MAG: Helicase associated domain protein, partial [Clostridia bacterium]|nr:Helicase associated domain protein [Clostridia bacterium]